MKYHTFFFFRKLGKISQNLSSAAFVIGALMVNPDFIKLIVFTYKNTFLRPKNYTPNFKIPNYASDHIYWGLV